MSSTPPFSPSSVRSRLLPQSPKSAPNMASGGGTPRSPSSPSSTRRRPMLGAALAAADAASWYCALLLLSLILLSSLREGGGDAVMPSSSNGGGVGVMVGSRFPGIGGKPCDEIYVVGEGETLHTISDKCKDPFIVERNPHIHDPDDVFPGLVIKIVPLSPGQQGA